MIHLERRRRWVKAEWDVMEKLDLPAGIAPDLPTVELSGNREVYVAGHRGVLSYSTELVEINGGALVIRVGGRDLQLLAMTDTELRLNGVITRLELIG
ncbi:MAG: sporulation protein [Oscillospiraceae bacterium]|nr:sporulation protein [Oscillospiraceae bacterium]